MKNRKKLWILSFICVGLGAVVLGIGLFLGGKPGFQIDGSGVHPAGEVMNISSAEGEMDLKEFSSMDISAEYADVQIVPSDHFGVEYCVMKNKNTKPICEVKGGKLTFKEATGSIGGIWNFSFSTEVVTEKKDYFVKVYVPSGEKLSSVDIKTDDGNVTMSKLAADRMEISDEYGDVQIGTLECDTFKADIEDGSLTVENIEAAVMEISNEYGDVTLKNAVTGKLQAKLADGDFCAKLLDCPNTDISNEYGSITLKMAGKIDEYALDLTNEYGGIEVPGYEIASGDDGISYKINTKASKKVRLHCEDGDIILSGK